MKPLAESYFRSQVFPAGRYNSRSILLKLINNTLGIYYHDESRIVITNKSDSASTTLTPTTKWK